MKKHLALFILLTGSLLTTPKLQAQTVSACISDYAGFHYYLTVTVTGGKYTGKGNADVLTGFNWKAKLKGTCFGSTTLTVTNPKADGCASGYTDYFVYSGTAVAALFYGTEFRYDGSGTWESFCSGGVINTGTWNAQDCYHSPSPGSKVSKENNPTLHGVATAIKASPNPVNGQANISYAVTKSGTVNITVYNSMQQAVKVLVNDFKNAGNYSAVWDTKTANINAGVYRVVAVIDGKTTSTTVQVVK